jgi:hypothetical protein
MTNWLRSDPNPNYLPLDLSNVSTRLAQLESTFAAVAHARKGIDSAVTTVDTPQRRAMLAQLKADADTALATAVSDVRAAFGDLLAAATANQHAAARAFADSPDGAQYLQGLAGFSAIAAAMPPEALASKIHSLVDAGLVGQARAMAEVASLADDGSPQRAAVSAAVRRANTEAITPAEATTAAEAAYIQNASDTFTLWTGTIASRTEDAITNGEDTYGVGNFTAANIFGGTDGATE